MIRGVSCLLSAMICLSGAAYGQGSPVSVLVPGVFHGDEVSEGTGGRWHGLFQAGSGFRWRAVAIAPRAAHDALVDEADEKTGVEIAVKGDQPVVLVRGVPGIGVKKVRGVFYSAAGQELPDREALTLRLPKDRDYQIRVTDRSPSYDAPEKPSRLVLQAANREQVLYEWPRGLVDQHCELIWAGDLDGDGRLDLLMGLSDHYNVVEHVLFLSSQRLPGEFVRRVAGFVAKGC